MADWNEGYVTDINYTYGYYTELNPIRIPLALSSMQIQSSNIRHVCELGFGQGVSAVIHAAAQGGASYWGTDFNPSQAAHARSLAESAGIECHFFDQSFDEFCTRDDLPEFDFISLHGIWSWISDHNRGVIVDFLRRKLKVGGVLYVSYNTLPGWASALPMRHLLSTYAQRMHGAGEGVVARVEGAMDFFEKLAAVKPGYLNSNPKVLGRFEKMKGQNKEYLAHEYFNRDWEPMHFATMESWLQPAKLSYACSAHLFDHVDAINFTAPQIELLSATNDRSLRQSVRDMIVNQQFRRDYWIKGELRINAFQQKKLLTEMKYVLIKVPQSVTYTIQTSVGEVQLHKELYEPLVQLMSDFETRSIKDMLSTEQMKDPVVVGRFCEACMILTAHNVFAVVQSADNQEKSLEGVYRLNEHILELAEGETNIQLLASPLTGGAINVDKLEQIYLLAMRRGFSAVSEIAEFSWQILRKQGVRMVREGKTLSTSSENIEELNRLISIFTEQKLPLLKKMKVLKL